MACNIRKELDVNDCGLAHFTIILSLHYFVKCRNRGLAVDNNEFILGSECVGSEISYCKNKSGK